MDKFENKYESDNIEELTKLYKVLYFDKAHY
jgi:hypothetical protein